MDGSIWDHFAIIPDPRIERTKKHKLQDIMALGVCAVICGAEHWTHIEEFGRANEEWFRTFLELPHGVPSHDTFGGSLPRWTRMVLSVHFKHGCMTWPAVHPENTSLLTARPYVGVSTGPRPKQLFTWSAPGSMRTTPFSGRFLWTTNQMRLQPFQGCWRCCS